MKIVRSTGYDLHGYTIPAEQIQPASEATATSGPRQRRVLIDSVTTRPEGGVRVRNTNYTLDLVEE